MPAGVECHTSTLFRHGDWFVPRQICGQSTCCTLHALRATGGEGNCEHERALRAGIFPFFNFLSFVTVSGPSPHTSRPLSRLSSCTSRFPLSACTTVFVFGTDHLVYVLLPLITLRSISSPIPTSMYITRLSSPRILGKPTCILLCLCLRSRTIPPTPDFRLVASRSRAFRPADHNNFSWRRTLCMPGHCDFPKQL